VAKERDEALKQVDELRKECLLEGALFNLDAEGRTGGDNRGQPSLRNLFRLPGLALSFRLSKDSQW